MEIKNFNNCANSSDYKILVEEMETALDKWHKRLEYQSGEKEAHDIYLCSTVIYEIEQIKQRAANKIAQLRVDNAMTKR